MYSVLNTLSEYTYFYISKNITSHTFLLVFKITERLSVSLNGLMVLQIAKLRIHKNCIDLWLTVQVCQWWMLKNRWNTFKISGFGQTTKHPLSSYELWKSWKYQQLLGLGPDPSCLYKNVYSMWLFLEPRIQLQS